jgi:hypothetical protein
MKNMSPKQAVSYLSEVPAHDMVVVTVIPYVDYEPVYTRIFQAAEAIKHFDVLDDPTRLGDEVVSIYKLGDRIGT